ncbi:MAG: tetratricopeptide repeat protein [Chromatiales bacterium]|jgi:Tfp pilus assembly protein PilF
MHKPLLYKHVFAALVFLSSSMIYASAETDFEQGVKAFKAGDNSAAVDYFESAIRQGMDSVALHYNLASSYYKLGKYELAKKHFGIVHQTPEMRDLAEYNLGLIALQEKQWQQARDYFNAIVTRGSDKKLTALSEKQLARLSRKDKTVQAYGFVNLGYDDNITSASDDSVLNQAEFFYDLYGSVDYLLAGNRNDGWLVDASVYRIDYQNIDTTDENQYAVGLKKTFALGNWDNSVRLKLNKSTFGEENFQSSAMLDLRGQTNLSRSERLYLRYRYEDIRSDKLIYDYLEGSRQRARIEYRNFSRRNLKQIYYELELNNRGTLTTASYAYDYSPTRHTLSGKYTHYLNDEWSLGGDLSYRFSDYPSSATIDREDEQWRLGLSADYRIDKTLKLTTRLQYIDNSSTEDRYEYDKSVFRVGLSKSF